MNENRTIKHSFYIPGESREVYAFGEMWNKKHAADI